VRDLSAVDAAFLYAESAHAPMHVAALQIYDAGSVGGELDLQRIVERVATRAHLIDCFHDRMQRTPWRLDFPHWVDDPTFEPEDHIHEHRLPEPGDWSALRDVVSELVAEPISLDRPPWEMHVIRGLGAIEGFPADAFAIVTKIHHCAVDGVAGIGVTAALHDLEPAPAVMPAETGVAGEKAVSPASLALTGWLKEVLRPLRVAAALPALQRLSLQAGRVPRPAPPTRFNRRISGQRVFDSIRMPLDRLRGYQSILPGAKLNDVALAWIGGALRRYLAKHGELPVRSLMVMVPVSAHLGEPQANTGNQVAQIIVTLGTDIEDFPSRLREIHARTSAAKADLESMDAESIDSVTSLMPAAMVELGARLFAYLPGLPFNTVVTNVRGPAVPLYFCGARLTHAFGTGPLADGLGLFHTIMSYQGELSLSVLACPQLMPDIEDYIGCLRAELAAIETQGAAHAEREEHL
jgi:diacylglycerol O-acyltransferase